MMYMYMFCQQFNSKIATSKLSRGNMTALYNLINYYDNYYDDYGNRA